MRFGVRNICKSAAVAAFYAALTVILQPISFGAVQFRVSEALTLLPLIMPEAVPGLFIGCVIANLAGTGVLLDVVFGSLATLAAAFAARALRRVPLAAAAAPVTINGLVVGPVVYFCYVLSDGAFSPGALAYCCLTVALGEAAVVYTLGLALVRLLGKTGIARIGA